MAGTLTQALTIVLAINMMLWFGQLAVSELNPASATNFFNPEGSLLDQYNEGNYTLTSGSDSLNQLPEGESGVSETTGNIFTDLFSTVKRWFLESTGLSYVLNILSAPMSFLKALHLPQEFAFGLGAMWYGITLFLIIAFIRGDSG